MARPTTTGATGAGGAGLDLLRPRAGGRQPTSGRQEGRGETDSRLEIHARRPSEGVGARSGDHDEKKNLSFEVRRAKSAWREQLR